ncbi:MAG: biopolymer transporter ExbD, partial [Betaproteobacteria bacterium]|nr:biopolymer transporter ExbD [Betaproteobacteria bacterium]
MLIEKRSGRRLMNQINVVPYIDVMLVLLVIFMVTAPLINPGQVELPSIGKTSAPPVAPLEVSVDKNGALSLRDRDKGATDSKVTRDELLAAIREKQKA